MSGHAVVTTIVCILIVCLGALVALAQLVWMIRERWDGLKALGCIFGAFIVAYIMISYMVVVVREYVNLPNFLWE